MKSTLIRFIFIALLAFSFVVNYPWFSQKIFAQTPIFPLLQQGLEEYQQENFSTALRTWQNALQQTENSDNKALIYNYLSLVQQHLGEWEEAQISIDRALELLPKNDPELQARILNSQGQLYWALGQPENALKQWQKATQLYQQTDRIDGEIGTKINQAQALQVLGFGLQAESQLQDVNALIEKQLEKSPLKVNGYLELGKVWRQIGKLEESHNILKKAKDMPFAGSEIWLELGNTERALSDRAVIFGKQETEIEEYTQAALHRYQKAAEIAETDTLKVQAQLNQLSFLIKLGEGEKAIALQQKLQPLLNQLPLSHSSIEAQLNFNRSLICLWDRDNPENVPGCSSRQSPPYEGGLGGISLNVLTGEQIAYNLAEIVERSQTLADRLAESSARGLLGEIYERTGQLPEARNLTREALLLAEDKQASNLLYRWEWQLGRLLKKQGQPQSAIAAYKASVNTLAKLRSHLLPIDTNIQFDFRDNIEPVYRELVDLLITEDAENEQSQTEAVHLIDELQLAELEDFLRCHISPTFSIDESLENFDRKAALVYPVLIHDKLVIFSKFPGQNFSHYIVPQTGNEKVGKEEVEQVARDLYQYILEKTQPQKLKEKAGKLYDWLLKPLEDKLEQNQNIKTLVFVLDGFLRNIPISVLYDNDKQEYVVQKQYSIVVLPSLQVFDLTSLPRNQINILAAGVSEDREIEGEKFEGLEQITEELQTIQKTFPSQVLLNSEFSLTNLKEKLQSQSFSILHLATHGKFSSDLEQTYVLADRELLRVRDIKELIKIRNDRQESLLNLLVLSACETATGDDRAIFGLSGVAVQSGARSTLATLWQISSASNSELMKKFYHNFVQTEPQMTTAEALHQAQLELFNQVYYKKPYFWAAYILVGNWL